MTPEIQTLSLTIAVTEAQPQQALALLEQHHLPVTDLDGEQILYLLRDGSNDTIGTAGLEVFNDCGLLRSISVINQAQGTGAGKFIVTELESIAKQKGISCLYLLTTTAADFFGKLGYAVVARDAVPDPIRQTTEFSSLCPSSAVVMKKGCNTSLLII